MLKRAVLLLLMVAMALAIGSNRSSAQVPTNKVVLASFQFAVSVAGTPAQLGTTTGATVTGTQPGFCRQIAIQPLAANTTAQVQVMSSSGGANTGYQLQAGQQLVVPVQGPLTSIWIRVGTNGDGVSCLTWSD